MASISSYWRAWVVLFTALLLFGCPESEEPATHTNIFGAREFGSYEFDGAPNIEAEAFINFGEVRIGDTTRRTLEVKNIGNEPLEFNHWVVSPEFQLLFPNDVEPTKLGRGESAVVTLVYTAHTDEEVRGRLVIGSNDPDTPLHEVQLFANAKFPCLTFEPAAVDFGTVDPGEAAERRVQVSNCSAKADTTFTFEGISGDREFVRLQSRDFSDVTLEPGESVDILIGFMPRRAGAHQAVMHFTSNDMFNPEQEVMLTGNGRMADCPVAVLEAFNSERGTVLANPLRYNST